MDEKGVCTRGYRAVVAGERNKDGLAVHRLSKTAIVLIVKKLLSIILVISWVLLLLVMSGCGGSDSGETSLSKKQFVKKAKAICLESETEQYKQGFSYIESHPGAEEEDAVIPAALPPIEKELTKLQELPAPDQIEAQVTAFYKALEKGIADTKKDPGSALVQKGNPFKAANKLAEEAGLEGCSANP
jgi:hypothetical protein